jgi:hypothetical protein
LAVRFHNPPLLMDTAQVKACPETENTTLVSIRTWAEFSEAVFRLPYICHPTADIPVLEFNAPVWTTAVMD